MEHPDQQRGYSAEVRLELRAGGKAYDLASVGPNRFIPRNPIELDACDAEVAMYVDGDLFIWPVRLPFGAYPFEQKVVTSRQGIYAGLLSSISRYDAIRDMLQLIRARDPFRSDNDG